MIAIFPTLTLNRANTATECLARAEMNWKGRHRLMGAGPASGCAVLSIAFLILSSIAAKAEDWIIGSAQAEVASAIRPEWVDTFNAAPRPFNIQPQPLAKALDNFCTETGVIILYRGNFAQHRVSPGVVGTYTPLAALQQILLGSNLIPQEIRPGAITLAPVFANVNNPGETPPRGATMLTLNTLHVEAPPNEQNVQLYTASLQYSILNALQRYMNEALFSATVNVWVTNKGSIGQSEIVVFSGEHALMPKLLHVINGADFGEPPPTNLPQPVHIKIGGQRQQ